MSDVEPGAETSGEKLLVVDDDPFIARLLEIELAAAGYQVRVANDGQQAMDQVGQDPPDLVITDVMMPHVDGFELTRSLRQDPRTATISVIILTARGLSADKLEDSRSARTTTSSSPSTPRSCSRGFAGFFAASAR